MKPIGIPGLFSAEDSIGIKVNNKEDEPDYKIRIVEEEKKINEFPNFEKSDRHNKGNKFYKPEKDELVFERKKEVYMEEKETEEPKKSTEPIKEDDDINDEYKDDKPLIEESTAEYVDILTYNKLQLEYESLKLNYDRLQLRINEAQDDLIASKNEIVAYKSKIIEYIKCVDEKDKIIEELKSRLQSKNHISDEEIKSAYSDEDFFVYNSLIQARMDKIPSVIIQKEENIQVEDNSIEDEVIKKVEEEIAKVTENTSTFKNLNIDIENAIEKEESIDDEVEVIEEFDVIDSYDDDDDEEIENTGKIEYKKPLVTFLTSNPNVKPENGTKIDMLDNSKKLEETLASFNVKATVIGFSKGPTVTRYEVQPAPGVKVSKIANLADDLALNLAAEGIRIQAPIPGRPAVGIEVPNEESEAVYISDVLNSDEFIEEESKLAFGVGKDITGDIVVADLADMPHLLIAGATGSGKSVCINTLITSILYKAKPEEVKLLLIDPKIVELSIYNGIPHLLIPVVTDPKKAAGSLNWAVKEMEKRYALFATENVRDLEGYNRKMTERGVKETEPQIVIIIDELADLMMTASKEVETAIMRIAQKARAAGIHLIIATQRPSVDVITGVIKANIPSRLAFSVSASVDSKTILDTVGAEKLLGKGDMLFYPRGSNEPKRIQGAFISDKEVENIVDYLKKMKAADYLNAQELIDEITTESKGVGDAKTDKVDELFEEVVEFIFEKQKASASLLQRQFRIGYNRASTIVDQLEHFGLIGESDGSKPRKVLMTRTEWDERFKV